MKNAYVGRTFIQPSQTIRQLGIRLKLNPLRENVRGKRLVVVDDSIVRGNTQRAIVRMLREAGALEVHVRISSPPVKWPCFYGIDFATRAELLANGLDNEGIRRSIGADSLGYVSLDGLIAATEQPKTRLCRACFDGEYPIELPAGNLIGKHVLEGVGRRVDVRARARGRRQARRRRAPSQPPWHRPATPAGRSDRVVPAAPPTPDASGDDRTRCTATAKGRNRDARDRAPRLPAQRGSGGDRQPWTAGGSADRKRTVDLRRRRRLHPRRRARRSSCSSRKVQRTTGPR